MNRTRALIIAGSAGWLLFAVLFPRWSASARWTYELDRRGALERARETAAAWGIDTHGWTARVSLRGEGQHYLDARRDVPQVAQLSPVETLVVLGHPSKAESVRIRMDGRGSLVALQLPPVSDAGGVDARRARGIAEEAAERFGFDLRGARLTGEEALDERRWRFRWMRPVDGAPELTLTYDVELEGARVRRLRRDWTVSEAFLRTLGPDRPVLEGLAIALRVITFLGALVMLVRALVQRSVPRRPLRRLALTVLLVGLAFSLTSPRVEEGWFESGEDRGPALVVAGHDLRDPETYAILLVCVFLAVAWSAYWGGGLSASRRTFPASSVEFEEILRGRLARDHGGSMLAGAFAAGVLAGVPYVLAAAGLAPYVLESPAGLVALDLRVLLQNPVSLTLSLLVFAFVVPVLRSASWLRAGAVPLAIASAALLLWDVDNPFTMHGLLTAGVSASVLIAMLWYRGVVSVLAAAGFANLATRAAILLEQPSDSLSRQGLAVALAGVAAAGAALLLARRGPPLAVDASVERAAGLSARERMQEEFDFAREAQRKMLPVRPPTLERFSLEGVCRPARQVGGDLFDYISLRDGKMCIVVADVCGKGVPAALYMTIVKGLLLAASDASSDPVEIASDVNAGLHAIGQRNVFVTMFLGVLDPATRELRFVRAGHNPALWHRPGSGDVISLAPRGMALGMTGSSLFRNSLVVEQITLAPDDSLVVHSDGVTEAMNERREEFGDDRLLHVLRTSKARAAHESRDVVLREVEAFVGRAPAHDDLTLVVLRAS